MLDKAKMNQETGEWAKDKKYCDVAVSRYYYSIYQKIIALLKNDGYYTKPKGEDPHEQVISDFMKYIYDNKLAPEEISKLANVRKLKKKRIKADYEEQKTEFENEFTLEFMPKYYQCKVVLDRILTKKGIVNNE